MTTTHPPDPDGTGLDLAVPWPDEALMGRLYARLGREAEATGVLDIAYGTLDTPVGSLLLAATERGVIRVAFAAQDHEAALQQLSDKVSPRILQAPARLDVVSRQLDEYFDGRRHTFDVPLDWTLASGFRRTALDRLYDIGYGHTATYAELAAAAGSPRAVRAAGTACATNPLPLVVPCHRVVRADGSIGRYAGGVDAKRYLLGMESST
ncbi:methylated-DNA--[protein]-cysteine S-methyltransferase [Streptomyces sp. LP11]|uniref:Methylated-DNA--protein-cysteine methyltransferase n=1 Tax=Streptomyces pyxinicus TaxID=2970331 RepID=A0ABT2B505_9ACTN|nr:methylated-DNA--[protein]-cysteine S-methyltransferase [Streptomyces sp. LP11]MCS0603608.1 methylated-DNA--[protein]-cysteine S-methyltransferase [Streptomyces sp. LP11]